MPVRIRFYKLTMKRVAVGTTAVLSLMMVVYFNFFNHGTSEDILSRNLAKLSLHGERPSEENYDYDEDDLSQVSRVMWNRFIADNHFVSIGEIFNDCGATDRIMLGRTVMLPDKVRGGVKSMTYANISWDHVIEYGDFYIDVKYNNKSLYNNKFDICSMNKKFANLVSCPIKKGLKFYQKEMKIPNFLPKGLYTVKGSVMDHDKKTVLCGHASFRL